MKREGYLDALKGLLILLVCLVHFSWSVLDEWFYIWRGTIVMRSFFMVCGWIYALRTVNEWNAGTTFHKRLRQLGKPYLWFSAILLCVMAIWWLIGYVEPVDLGKEAFKTLVLKGIGTLWFLPVLGIAEILFVWIMRRSGWRHGVWVILMIAAMIITNDLVNDNPIQILDKSAHPFLRIVLDPYIDTLIYLPAIYIGYWMGWIFKDYFSHKASRKRCISTFLTGFALLALAMLLPFPELGYLNEPHALLRAAASTIGLICLFYVLDGRPTVRFLKYCGRNSLIIMAVHYTILLEMCMIFDRYVLGNTEFIGPRTLIYLAVSVAVMCPVAAFINKKMPFLIGKKRH